MGYILLILRILWLLRQSAILLTYLMANLKLTQTKAVFFEWKINQAGDLSLSKSRIKGGAQLNEDKNLKNYSFKFLLLFQKFRFSKRIFLKIWSSENAQFMWNHQRRHLRSVLRQKVFPMKVCTKVFQLTAVLLHFNRYMFYQIGLNRALRQTGSLTVSILLHQKYCQKTFPCATQKITCLSFSLWHVPVRW